MKISAAGALIYAQDTGNFLVVKRSPEVGDPNLWCGVGGKIEEGETPEEACRREVMEEIGHGSLDPLAPDFMTIHPAYVYDSDVLHFHNFIGVVPNEFKPELNWENADYKWCKIADIPDPEHYGLQALLGDDATLDIIDRVQQEPKQKILGNRLVEANVGDIPFLSKLGVSLQAQASSPTVATFPIAFNPNNHRIWNQVLNEIKPSKDPLKDWGKAINAYTELCVLNGTYPFSNMHQSVNDVISSELTHARKTVVKFMNTTGMLKLIKIRDTDREVTMTSNGFVVKVYGIVELRDKTFLEWLKRSGSPRFDIIKDDSRYVKRLDKSTKLFVYNEGVTMAGRWHVGYEIEVNRFPDLPGNYTPSRAELEDFIIRVLYMPILLSHRPFGHTHRLL